MKPEELLQLSVARGLLAGGWAFSSNPAEFQGKRLTMWHLRFSLQESAGTAGVGQGLLVLAHVILPTFTVVTGLRASKGESSYPVDLLDYVAAQPMVSLSKDETGNVGFEDVAWLQAVVPVDLDEPSIPAVIVRQAVIQVVATARGIVERWPGLFVPIFTPSDAPNAGLAPPTASPTAARSQRSG